MLVAPAKNPKPLFKHQTAGIEFMARRPGTALFDDMGLGKSRQVIELAADLYVRGVIQSVLVICPAPAVRFTWTHPEFGQLVEHSRIPSSVHEISARMSLDKFEYLRRIHYAGLTWFVTNYELVRSSRWFAKFQSLMVDHDAMLVLDESSKIKNPKANQTKVCIKLSRLAEVNVILNGTPIIHSPLDLWAQMQVVQPGILPFKNYFHFRARYAIMGGFLGKQILGWQNLEELQNLIQPVVIRRLKEDCLDLPPKLFSVLEIPMSKSAFETYKEMRDEAIISLGDRQDSVAPNALTRLLRLSQLTGGFLGGISSETNEEKQTWETSREKHDFLVEWIKERVHDDPGIKIIVWCRFRAERERLAKSLKSVLNVFQIYGGQPPKDRAWSLEHFNHRHNFGAGVLLGQAVAGGFSLNLTASHTVVYYSCDFSLGVRLQSEDRCHRIGQTKTVNYFDLILTGPKGQRTIDHTILTARRKKYDLAKWTSDKWRESLAEE